MATDNTLTNKRIRLRIPKDYHQEPVISRLVSDYGLTVNITAAILGANAVGDGWFDLELQGIITKKAALASSCERINIKYGDRNRFWY
ncbi:NIL domain-containing protein [Nostoc sp. CALU 1950]|uniref:NIL domain-containing protein n=1 Tax=Nostoc sp. CALU 1950 TaxID=3104321 RepID=UPI003EB91C20